MNNMVNEGANLANVLRLLRISRDMSIKELSQAMNISASYISDVESGKKKPSMDTLQKYSVALGVPRSSILFFEEQSPKLSGYKKLLMFILSQVDKLDNSIDSEEEIDPFDNQ